VLDVHPPHTATHTWRDFLLHIATIVIGLLIAIGLEQTVEYLHHRHLATEARDSLRAEFDDNRQRAAQNMEFLLQLRADLYADLQVTARMRQKALRPTDTLSFSPPIQWALLSDSEWTLARESGAALYLKPSEQQEYGRLYTYQDKYNLLMQGNLGALRQSIAPLYDPSTAAAPTPAILLTSPSGDPAGLDRLEQSMQGTTNGSSFPQISPQTQLSPQRLDDLEKGLREHIAYVETALAWCRSVSLRLEPSHRPE
jgi:hypothetical protein